MTSATCSLHLHPQGSVLILVSLPNLSNQDEELHDLFDYKRT